MKKLLKQFMTIFVVFALVIALSPISSLAKVKSPNGVISYNNSSTCYTVLYPGGKPKPANYSITCKYVGNTYNNNVDDYIEYEMYDVSVIINKQKLTNDEVVRSWKNLKRQGGTLSDYAVVFIDKDGDSSINFVRTGGFNEGLSSRPQKLLGKSGKRTYFLNGWRKQVGFSYRVLIPQGHEPIYVGVVGLRNGQPNKATKKRFAEGAIGFYNAGFGSNKAGYIWASKIK